MYRRSADSPSSPGYRQMIERTSSRDHTSPMSATNQFVGGYPTQTTDPTPRSPRQRARSNSTPDKRLSTSGHTVTTSLDPRKHQDRNTWSAGSASPVVQRSPSTLQRSPSTAGRNPSHTNLQPHRSPSNSPTTPANIQRTPSNLPTYTSPPISRRYSKSSSGPARSRPILFYHKHEPHYGFTNFSNHAVKYEGRVYPTSEHLFQSLKVCAPFNRLPIDLTLTIQFAHRPLLAEHIRTCDSRPSVAFSEARRFQPEVRQDWKYYNIKAVRLFVPGFSLIRLTALDYRWKRPSGTSLPNTGILERNFSQQETPN